MSRFLTASLRVKSTYNIYWNTWRLVHPLFALRLHDWLHRLLGRRMERVEIGERRVGCFHMDEREMFVHFTGLFIKLIYCGVAAGSVFGLWSAAILVMLRYSNGTTPGTCRRRRRHSTSICCYHFCVLPPYASVWAAMGRGETTLEICGWVCVIYVCVICVIN